MKALLPGLVLAAALAACDHIGDRSTPGPLYIQGSADPRTGEGMVSSVSRLFERAEVEKLHARRRNVEVAALDKGPPINCHYHDPLSGKELPPEAYAREAPQEPRCDCSKADSGGEWVTWPGAQDQAAAGRLTAPSSAGPGKGDPDGTPILIDQHVPSPRK